VTILMSDILIKRNYREMHGFGSHTFSLINAQNERFWVKFHFKSMQGITYYTDAEAGGVVANDRESAQRDLYDQIEAGNFPRWHMRIQVMPEQDALTYRINPFDLTKVWPHKDYPLIDVGILELNRNPQNYFAEVEQAAMNPANVVPGIGFSPDKMLQGRLFSYGDTQRYRLGVNHNQIPVNAPRCPFHNVHRDGLMRVDGNNGGGPNYQPNTVGGPVDDRRYNEPPLTLAGAADHFDHRVDSDYYSQAGDLFRLMTPDQQQRLFGNIGRSLGGVTRRDIQVRQIKHFYQADPAYGAGVAAALGIDLKSEVLAAAAE
jgi:catalase